MVIKRVDVEALHSFFNFLKRDGEVVAWINTYIHDATLERILHRPMAVSMQHVRSMMRLVPRHHRKVGHADAAFGPILLLELQLKVILCLVETFRQVLMLLENLIVISKTEVDVSVQATQHPLGLLVGSKAEISEMEDDVLRGDNRIPVRDQRFMHLAKVSIWPLRILDDVRMEEVGVRCEKVSHCSTNR